MSISSIIPTAIIESGTSNYDQCKLCERQGVPIFITRQALVPSRSFHPSANLQGPVDTALGWRTLRTGYLYVLLDQRHWQAYQVTADGYLRRFDPYTPPPGNNFLLPDKCTAADHDSPSSFINIDIDQYDIAWLAFASDPWTPSVLAAYKAQRANERFTLVDLRKLRNVPGYAGGAMTPDELCVDQDIFEYQAHVLGHFNTAHAFYSRVARLRALSSYITTSMERYLMPNGIPLVMVEDPVGLVEEYNHQRNAWVHARQKWMADPDRAYRHQTSQILLAIRALHPSWADAQIPKDAPLKWDQSPVHFDNATTRPPLVEAKAKDFDERLEERYDEPQRAKFQAGHDQELARYQQRIDKQAEGYVEALQDPPFIAAQEYDYDEQDFDSVRAYVITMAKCLSGGISEAPVALGEADDGPVAMQWKAWLENPQSPAYRALLLRDSDVLAGLLPSFSAEGEAQWSDSARMYDALTKAINSDEGGHLRRVLLRDAVADLQGALNSASARLQPVLSPSIQHVVSRVNSATQLLYNGIHLVELTVNMKLGEYYALHSEHLRNLQRQAAEALANAPRRMVDGLVDMEARWAADKARKIRPILLGGVLNLAALDPKLASDVVKVSVWVEGKAGEVRQALALGANLGIEELSRGVGTTLQTVSVGVSTLQPQVRQMFEGLQITSQQASRLVREGLTGLRGAAGSGPVLVAVGTLYLLSDLMKRNYEAVSQVIGDKSPEARVAFYGSSMGVIGGAVELVGLVMEKSAKQVMEAHRLGALGMGTAKDIATVGNVLVRVGATMVAAVGVFDAVQAGMAAGRARRSGDGSATIKYSTASVIFGFGVGFGVWAAATSSMLLWGPLGWAVLLGIAGYAFYKLADGSESTPLEAWARRSFFGHHNEIPPVHWSFPEDAGVAIAALNAATLGADAGVNFERHFVNLGSRDPTRAIGIPGSLVYAQFLKFGVRLPYFNPAQSIFRWALTVHRSEDKIRDRYQAGKIIASGDFGVMPEIGVSGREVIFLDSSYSLSELDYDANSIILKEDVSLIPRPEGGLQIKTITGSVGIIEGSAKREIEAATFSLHYWPDQNTSEGYIELAITTLRSS